MVKLKQPKVDKQEALERRDYRLMTLVYYLVVPIGVILMFQLFEWLVKLGW